MLVSFCSSLVLLLESSSAGHTMLIFSSEMKQREETSVPWPREAVGERGAITTPCPWDDEEEEEEEAGQISRRSFSTSGKGLTVAKRVW